MLFLLRKHRCRGCGTSIEANYVFAGSRCTPCHNAWMEREWEFEKARREQRIAEIEEGVKRALGQLRSKVT